MRSLTHVGSALVGWPLLPELVSAPEVSDGPSEWPAPLEFWFDASDASTRWQDAGRTTPATTAGQEFRGFDDKSGNGLHLVGSASTVTLVDEGGYPAIETASGAILSSAPFTTTGPVTYLFAGRINDASGGVFAHNLAPGGGIYGDYLYKSGEAAGYRGTWQNGGIAFAPSAATRYVWALRIDPGTAKPRALFVNGTLSDDDGADIGSGSLTGPLVVGALTAVPNFTGLVRVSEFASVVGALSDGEIAIQSARLMTKWGI